MRSTATTALGVQVFAEFNSMHEPATGIMAFDWSGIANEWDKVEALKRVYTRGGRFSSRWPDAWRSSAIWRYSSSSTFRPDHDKTPSQILVSRFAQRFNDSQWPGDCRLPEVFYDPRSVADEEPVRSSLHAKCIVVDGRHVFVSSANFTEAGQQRKIEVGLNIQSEWLAERLIRHFKVLHEHRLAVRAF